MNVNTVNFQPLSVKCNASTILNYLEFPYSISCFPVVGKIVIFPDYLAGL